MTCKPPLFFLPLLLLPLGSEAFTAGRSCYPPFSPVGGQCLYVEYQTMSWQEARDFCRSMAGDGAQGDLASFPTCNDYTAFARYLAFNAPTDEASSSLWVGAHTLFTPNMWEWLSGDALQTGVPFWAYPEQYDDGENCASADGRYYYRLVPSSCDQSKGVVCSTPLLNPSPPEGREPFPGPAEDCPHEGIVIGEHCYTFSDKEESWSSAEAKCRESHGEYGGLLYYPSDCEEFARLAHHLEADESADTYWVGARDVTGGDEWTWADGSPVPGGPPFWASGQPSHDHDDEPREHCAAADHGMRYYLRDAHCDVRRPYICKLTKAKKEGAPALVPVSAA